MAKNVDVKYYCVENCVDPDVTVMNPWDFDTSKTTFDMAEDPAESKKRYKAKYFKRSGAKHCLFSLCAGLSPRLIITQGVKGENPCALVGGFVGDYDSTVGTDIIRTLRNNPPGPYLPARWSETQGHNIRLVWEFDKAIRVTSSEHANALLAEVANRVNAKAWGAAFDREACTNCGQHFDVGRRWGHFRDVEVDNVLNDTVKFTIPHELVQLWDFQVYTKLRKKVKSSYRIPFEDVADEAGRQFPGRITFPFTPGGRCNRFWDPTSDNMDGCLICEEGVRVFVPHDKPFMSWADILGMKFVDQYAAAKIAPVVLQTWFVTSSGDFVRWKEEEHRYVSRDGTTLRRDLVCEAGLDPVKKKGELLSEVDVALHDITSRREVEYQAPVIFFPHGPMQYSNDKRILNTSVLRVLPPTPDEFIPECGVKWDNPVCHEMFPFIHGLISTVFETNMELAKARLESDFRDPPPREDDNIQLKIFLSWLSSFYEGSALLKPTQGQCLVCAGDTNVGKSFLFREVVGRLMGGANASCANYYVDGDKFTDSLFNAPIHLIDDVIADLDFARRTAFTTRLKVVVATARLRYEQKFRNSVSDIPWYGRVVILCNMDPKSLQILPGLEQSTADKITMLRMGSVKYDRFFGGSELHKNIEAVRRELPYFARFLLKYRRPEDVFDKRMGVVAYQHPEMKTLSAGNDYMTTLVDALHLVLDNTAQAVEAGRAKAGVGITQIKGNARQIYDLVNSHSASAARDIGGARQLSQHLLRMVDTGYKVYKRRVRGSWEFTVPADFDDFMGENAQ